MNHGFSVGSRAMLRHSSSFAEHHRQDQFSVHSNVSVEEIDRSIDRALSQSRQPSFLSRGHSFVSTVKEDNVQSALPKMSAHKNAPIKGNKQQVKLTKDLLALLSNKKALNPLAVEPGSDISVSDVASVTDLEGFALDMDDAPKPEEPHEDELRGICETMEDVGLEHGEDETTSVNVSLPGMIITSSFRDEPLEGQLSRVAERGQPVSESFGSSQVNNYPSFNKELDDSIETFGSNNDDASSEPCASFAEESSDEYAPIRMSDRSYRSAFSSRRTSFASTGSALESISEVAVLEDFGNVPGSSEFMVLNNLEDSITTSDLANMKNIVSLDQVNHRSSFTLESPNDSEASQQCESNDESSRLNETLIDIMQQDSANEDVSDENTEGEDLLFYAQLFAQSLDQNSCVAPEELEKPSTIARDCSYGSTKSYGSAVSTSRLHRDSLVVHSEALEDTNEIEDPSAAAGEAQTTLEVDGLKEEDANFHEALMDIIDDCNAETLDDEDLDDHDLELYAQALADNIKAEEARTHDSGASGGIKKVRPMRRMRSSMSSMGSVVSGLHKDSFMKHVLSMDGEDDDDENSFEYTNLPPRRSSSGNLSIRSGLSIATDFGLSDEKKHSPNRPHPALEYPMFYYFLRRFPWLFEQVKVAYAYRWKLSYPLQRRIPFSVFLEKRGIFLNYGEVLLLLPFFCAIVAAVLYSFVIPSVAISGRVARFGLIGALLLAQRNSMVTFAIGMPFDRAILYHKLAGRLAGAAGVTHTLSFFLDPKFRDIHSNDLFGGALTGSVNISGTMIMVLMIALILSSLQKVRRQIFELFYYTHVVLVVGMAISAYFHSGILVPTLAALIWGVDLFIRSIIMARVRYPRKATLEIISETVVQLSFPKTANFAYNPGQYVYISVPEISWLEWHPFSISSSPKQMSVTFHIRKAGSWTRALYKIAQKKEQVSVLMEGPYGNLAVDILNDRKYKRIMLISGGIGLTPMQSICDQLLYERAKSRRELNSLQFIWIERDPVLMQQHEFIRRTSSVGSLGSLNMDDYLSSDGSIKFCDDQVMPGPTDANVFLGNSGAINGQLERLAHREHSTNIASQLLSLLPPDRTTDEELEDLYASQNLNHDGDDDSRTLPLGGESAELTNNEDETSFADNSGSWGLESSVHIQEDLANVLNMKVYLTGNSNGAVIPFAEHGRPDIPKLFETEVKKSRRNEKIAVLVSAPPKLMEVVQKACVRHSQNNRNVRFDYHSEYLGM